MSNLTNYGENIAVDAISAQVTHLALFTTDPGETGTQTGELTGNGYARQTITWTTASAGLADNSNLIEFTASGGDWSAFQWVGGMDASTGGNMVFYYDLVSSVTVTDGKTWQIEIGGLTHQGA